MVFCFRTRRSRSFYRGNVLHAGRDRDALLLTQPTVFCIEFAVARVGAAIFGCWPGWVLGAMGNLLAANFEKSQTRPGVMKTANTEQKVFIRLLFRQECLVRRQVLIFG